MANKDLLYSRQIAEIGEKTMGQLSQLHILIIGQKSVGFECSKCLTLMGVGNIYLYDNEETKITINETEIKTTNKDVFGLNFGLNAILNSLIESRKYSIAELTEKYLKTLNPFIQIHSSKLGETLNTFIDKKQFDLIILTDFRKVTLSNFLGNLNKNQKIVLGFTLGYYGLIHTNFSNHIVYDINGEPKRTSYLSNISYDGKILKGQLEKNNIFSIGDLTNYGVVKKCQLDKIEIETDGKPINLDSIFIEEVKGQYQPKFQKWDEIKDDISKWNILEIGKNKFPLENVLKHINNPPKQSKKKDLVFEECTLFHELYPIGSIIGGIIAHEAIKVTGKYLPMEQSLFVDASIFLPKNAIKEKSGFFGNIESLISNEILSKLKSSRIFMIGAGALGCEHAKNLIMMNSATTKQGLLSITDPDTISLSNLSRQFLFQNENIGELKSKVIETKLTSYFPKTKIKSYKDAVGKETYKTSFKYDFWRNQDILLGALDNHEARLYIDKQAVKFEKPLFESGTQGTKCHTQTIIPKKTITYGEIEDPPQESIPMCTIKNFPNNFTHCIEWALEAFHSIFSQTISDIIEIKKNKEQWLDSLRTQNNNNIFERISKVNLFLNHINKPEISTIIEEIYQEYFINPISILLNSFPEDLEENGERFWGGKRKRPQIVNLSSSKEFIEGINEGLKRVLKINSEIDYSKLTNKKVINTDIKFSLEELEKNKTKDINVETVGLLIENLRNFDDSKLKTMDIITLEFDKDCDFTLEILNSLAIQRAKCYGIDIGNINETRRIAGKIIPAISTTTTIVSGFVMLEILKYFSEENPYDFNINIGINQYIGFETGEAPIKNTGMYDKAYNSNVIVIPENITRWKKIRVSVIDDGVLTIKDLIEHLESELGVEKIDMIMANKEILDNEVSLNSLWSRFEIEYNDNIEFQIFIQDCLPVLTPPVFLSH